MGPRLPIWGAAAIVVATLLLAWAIIPNLHPAPKNEAVSDKFPNEQFPSTYKLLPSRPTIIRGATILTGTDKELTTASILLQDGKIAAIGAKVPEPAGAAVINGKGKFVTPGIIDIHSHLGVYPSPGVESMSDGNEATKPTTPEVRAENSVWPQDPGFTRALAGGVTALEILPGSANLIGGRSVVLKNVPSITAQGMKFPGAPYDLKMACGENPKRVYGEKGGPQTQMGNVAGYRAAFEKAREYREKWRKYWKAGKSADEPDRDIGLELSLIHI